MEASNVSDETTIPSVVVTEKSGAFCIVSKTTGSEDDHKKPHQVKTKRERTHRTDVLIVIII